MPIDALTNTTTTAETATARTLKELQGSERKVSSELGKDAFLQLFVAQLANQDPLEPAKDTEFISQLAQFSVLEQMSSLNTTMTSSQAYALTGKYVYAYKVVNGQETVVFGRVDAVINEGGTPYLVIGEDKYLLSDVVGVAHVDEQPTNELAQASNLIGKRVKAEFVNDENTTVTIIGDISKIVFENGITYAVINGEKVPVSAIVEVGTDESPGRWEKKDSSNSGGTQEDVQNAIDDINRVAW